MVWIDYAIIAIIGFSALVSLIRGFVREALSLITWGCAFFVATQFYPYLTIYLTLFEDTIIKNAIAIAILFISTLIVGTVINYVINSLVERTGLSSTDRVLGVCFGVLRGILIVSAILFFLDTFTSLPKSEDWQHSELIPKFSHIIRYFFDYLKNISSFLPKNHFPLGSMRKK
ncbi:MAG: colicin V production protein [Arsenophonus sp. NEOnobi-MAG3]